MTVYNIFDFAGNRGADLSYSVVHADLDLHDADTSFEFAVSNASCSDPPTEAENGILKTEIETQLGFEEDSLGLQITAVSCHRINQVMTATVLLTADATSEGTRRRRRRRRLGGNSGESPDDDEAADADDHSLGLVKRLAELSSKGDELFLVVSDIRVQLGASDQANRTLHTSTGGAKELLNQTVLVEQILSLQQANAEQLHHYMEEKRAVHGDQMIKRMNELMRDKVQAEQSLEEQMKEQAKKLDMVMSLLLHEGNAAPPKESNMLLIVTVTVAVAFALLLLLEKKQTKQQPKKEQTDLVLP